MNLKMLLVAVLTLAVFSSCEKEDVLKYVEIPSSQQDGLWGKVKSVESTEYSVVYNDETDSVTIGKPMSKSITTYDANGFQSGGTSFRLQKTVSPMIFQMNEKVQYLYDNDYRLTWVKSENYVYETASSTNYSSVTYTHVELDYDFNKRTVTATYTESEEGVYFKVTQVRVYGMKPNGALDADILDIYNMYDAEKTTLSPTQPEISAKRIVLAEDLLGNWTKSYIFAQYYDTDGTLLGQTAHSYKERTFIYY